MSVSLHMGDSFAVIPEHVEPGSVDAIITDPPYGTISAKWDKWFDLDLWWKNAARVLKDDGIVVMFSDQPFTSMVVCSNMEQYRYDWVWDKQRNASALNAKKRPIKRSEDILVFSKNTPRYYLEDILVDLEKPIVRAKKGYRTHINKDYGEFTQTKTGYPVEVLQGFKPVRAPLGQDKHPTEKPVDLMEFLTKLYTREGDTVLDPFMGSGSGGVAAVNLGRNFIGVEQDEKYFGWSVDRIKEASENKDKKDSEQEVLF